MSDLTPRTRWLALGVAASVVVLLQQQLRTLLDAIHAWETEQGLAVLPGLVLLAIVLLLYRQAATHDRRRAQAVTAVEQHERAERDQGLDNLTQFGLALAKANDMGILRDVVHLMLPRYVGDRPVWAVVRAKGKWESLVGGLEESPDKVHPDIEMDADQALKRLEGSEGEPEGSEFGGRIYFPLVVGESVTGVLSVESGGAGPSWRRNLGAAATLIGIAARNVQLAREVEENGVYDGLTGCFNRTHSCRPSFSAPDGRGRRSRSSCSTSTTSSPSTTPTAICAATPSSLRSVSGFATSCETATPSAATAARSSWCFCRTRRAPVRCTSPSRYVLNWRKST